MPHGGVEHLLMQRRQSRENAVRSYADGGSVQATAQKLQGMGRNGDTILAHINPEEAALLKRMGGSGKINPNTGLMSFEPGFGGLGGMGAGAGTTGNYGGGPEKDRDKQGPGNAGTSGNVDRDKQGPGNAGTSGNVDRDKQGPGNAGTSGNVDRDKQGPGNVGKTDTSGGPGSAPGGDGSKSGSQGMGAGTGSSGGKTDTSGGPGSAPGGDGSKTGSQGSGAGTGSIPSGGIASIPTKDLPAPTAVDAAKERAKYLGTTKIPDSVKLAFDRGMIPIEGGLDAQGNPLTSPKKAHGIAQVTDTTAPEAAADAGLTWDKNKYLTDTDYNYSIGLAYFNKLVNQFGNTYDAAGAYNAGPGTYKDYLAGKRSLPKETVNYQANFQKAMADPNAGFTVPDVQAGITGVAPKPVNIKPQDVSTTPAPTAETDWWDKTVRDLPGNVGGAIVSAMFPPAAIYGLAATGVNYFTGKETMPTIPGAINRAYYGDGSPTTSTTAPSAEEYYKYGAAGDGSPNTDPMQMYKEIYGGGSDKPLLGIESLDRSPLVPGIDPSLPSLPSVPPDATDPSVPLFEYNYSNFGITGVPTAEYKYSNFGL